MSLDYGYTCPIIDNDIESLKVEIKEHLESAMDEVAPYTNFEDDYIKTRLGELTESLYDQLAYLFEETRKSNEDMRTEADKVIDNLTDEVSDLKEINAELEQQISDLETENNDLQSALYDCENNQNF